MNTRKAYLPYGPGGRQLAKLNLPYDLIAKEILCMVPMSEKREI